MEETITVLGVTIRRSPASPVSEKRCPYLTNGFCKSCTCDECEGGFLMDQWRQDIRNGGSMRGPRECSCVERARSRKRLRDSGLSYLAARCTFDSFKTAKPWQQGVKKLAQDYLKDARRLSFFISGQSGCGKTHLCTAICNELIERGGSLRYFQWVRDGTRLKQLLCEGGDYEKEIRALIDRLAEGPAEGRALYALLVRGETMQRIGDSTGVSAARLYRLRRDFSEQFPIG